MFSSSAAYERYMGRWSALMAPLFAEFVEIRDGGRLLDVGCGTGSLVQTLWDRTERAVIVGVDPAQPFIEYSQARFPDPRIAFNRGSAAELPYAAGSFGQCFSLLVFQLIPQEEEAAAEMRRVTRSGGAVAACAWDDRGLEMTAVLREEAVRLNLAAEKGAKSGRSCGGAGQLAGLWRSTGLAAVEEAVLEIRTEFCSFEDYWLPLLGGVGPAGAYVASLDGDQRSALRDALRQRLLSGRPDGPFSLGARAWAVRGMVPT